MSDVELTWDDHTFGTVRARYSEEAHAVEQALHDMARGLERKEIVNVDTGAVVWSHNQLLQALPDYVARNG